MYKIETMSEGKDDEGIKEVEACLRKYGKRTRQRERSYCEWKH